MKRFSLAILLVMIGSLFVFGQTNTGRLTGVVTSPDGVLPGATVTLVDNKSGVEKTTTTNEVGAYTFPQLDPGTFTLTVKANGFKTSTRTNIDIIVGQEYSLNIGLEIGSVSE